MEDKKMPLLDHILELRTRIIRILILFLVFLIICFPISPKVLEEVRSLLPENVELIASNPLDYYLMLISLSILLATVLSFPYALFELFQFLKPGLYSHEKKFFLFVIPTSLVLFFLGATFSYFFIIPNILRYLSIYTGGTLPLWKVKNFFGFFSKLILAFGVVFQIPLLIFFLLKANLITVNYLKSKRMYVWGLSFLLAVFFQLDPSQISQIVLAMTIVFLFEASIFFFGLFKK